MFGEVKGFSDLAEVLSLYRITQKEVAAVQEFSNEAAKHIEQFILDFYQWIPEVPEFNVLFTRPGLVEKVKKQQAEYWRQFFRCELNENYIQSRFKVGNIHAAVNLPVSSYVAGMSFSLEWWVNKVYEVLDSSKETAFLIAALNKLFSLDMAIVSASYTQASNDLIEQQSRTLMELSTPTIQLWEGILVLPILGILDSRRAQDMTDVMLNKIQETNARSIIIDITGVPTVDSSVANHLIKITKATRLMGCECILSGIGPEIAQTLVHLGINLETIETSSNLKSAFQMALTKTGYHIKLKNKDDFLSGAN